MLPNDYKWEYTWWMDFTIADAFGLNAIQDTYNKAFKEWHDNRIAMQELTAVLNWKGWKFYESDNNSPIAKLYFKLYEECYDKCLNHFKGEELNAYWSFLDQWQLTQNTTHDRLDAVHLKRWTVFSQSNKELKWYRYRMTKQ